MKTFPGFVFENLHSVYYSVLVLVLFCVDPLSVGCFLYWSFSTLCDASVSDGIDLAVARI